MIQTTQHTAILLFTRSAKDEAKNKALAKRGSRNNVQVADLLIRHTKNKAEATGLPVFVYQGDLQKGDSFGDRLANGMETVLNLGYSAVIAIGNDCPHLTTKLLLKVDEQLRNQQIVLGPDLNNGVYLFGIQRSFFDKNAIAELAWQSTDLQKSLFHFTNSALKGEKIVWLPVLGDLNSRKDLDHFLHYSSEHTLSILLLELLKHTLQESEFSLPYQLSNAFAQRLCMRGPPVYFS